MTARLSRPARDVTVVIGASALVLLACGRPAAAQGSSPGSADQPYRHRVLGVFDERSGEAIEDADVTDILAGLTARTSSSGAVSLAFLPDGGGLVRIRKFGYEQVTMFVAISPADTAPVTVILNRVATLPTILTEDSAIYRTARLQGFAQRMRTAYAGHFIGEEQLRHDGNRPLGEVLIQRIPGIIITLGRHSGYLLQRSARCAKGGAPDVYLDGVKLTHPQPTPPSTRRVTTGAPSSAKAPVSSRFRSATDSSTADEPFDLAEFQTENLAGVEYYATASLAPVEFSGTSQACGVLVLWTREK